MKSKSGFTLVELLVVIVVLGILTTIAIVSYAIIQRDADDSTRENNATIIVEALERYYDKNGEYPSVRSLVNGYADNTGAAVAAKLGIDESVLVMPGMTGTNSLSSAVPTQANNYINYTALPTGNTPCQNDVNGGCEKYTLQYITGSGTPTPTISSRH